RAPRRWFEPGEGRGHPEDRRPTRRLARLARMARLGARRAGRRADAPSGSLNRLFDSTVLIAHLRGEERATALLEDGGPFASVISRKEIEGGMRSAERRAVARLFDALTVLSVTDSVPRSTGAMLRTFRCS